MEQKITKSFQLRTDKPGRLKPKVKFGKKGLTEMEELKVTGFWLGVMLP